MNESMDRLGVGSAYYCGRHPFVCVCRMRSNGLFDLRRTPVSIFWGEIMASCLGFVILLFWTEVEGKFSLRWLKGTVTKGGGFSYRNEAVCNKLKHQKKNMFFSFPYSS